MGFHSVYCQPNLFISGEPLYPFMGQDENQSQHTNPLASKYPVKDDIQSIAR